MATANDSNTQLHDARLGVAMGAALKKALGTHIAAGIVAVIVTALAAWYLANDAGAFDRGDYVDLATVLAAVFGCWHAVASHAAAVEANALTREANAMTREGLERQQKVDALAAPRLELRSNGSASTLMLSARNVSQVGVSIHAVEFEVEGGRWVRARGALLVDSIPGHSAAQILVVRHEHVLVDEPPGPLTGMWRVLDVDGQPIPTINDAGPRAKVRIAGAVGFFLGAQKEP